MKNYAAELLGTFLLALAVACSMAGTFPVPTPVIAGLTLGLGVYVLGGISGAHLNPAITIGLMAIKKISLKEGALYVIAQLLGGFIAMYISGLLVTPATVAADNGHMIVILEALGTFVLALGVASVVHGKATQGASGLVVGGALILGTSLAATGAHGLLNPAVVVGVGALSVSYIVGPIIGGIIGMLTYKALVE